MKKQIRGVLEMLRAAKQHLVPMFIFGLAAMLPHLAYPQVVSSKLNPLQVARLHSYPANQTTTSSFAVGTEPYAVAL